MKKFNDGALMRAVFFEETGTLTFYGSGAVTDTQRWIPEEIERFVRRIVFWKGVTSIGASEFSCDSIFPHRNFANLIQVSFFGKMNEIGGYAFEANPNLEEVRFHEGCRAIGEMAFRNCSALRRAVGITKECLLRPTTIRHKTYNETVSPFHGTPLQKRFQSRVAK